MIQKWSRYKVLQRFFDNPRKAFLIRELSRYTKLAQTAVRLHLKSLISDGILLKEKEGPYPCYRANRESQLFKILKVNDIIFRTHQSGLTAYIENAVYPSCIVLFGSASRGEDTGESDLDLFVQAQRAKVDVATFEKVLHRKVNILFEPDVKMMSPELLNNVANGIVLRGYLKVV